MLRRLINDAANRTARTSAHKAVGLHLHDMVWCSGDGNRDTIGKAMYDGVANAVWNVGINVYHQIDDIIGTKI